MGLAGDSKVLIVAWEQSSTDTCHAQGHLPYSGSVGYISGDCPFGIVDLACAHASPAGPPVCRSERRERGWEGRRHLPVRDPAGGEVEMAVEQKGQTPG